MKELVLFSGGLDSTYNLYRLLTWGVEVDTLYVNASQDLTKAKAEKAAVEKILRALRENENLNHLLGEHYESDLTLMIPSGLDAEPPGLRQAVDWVYMAAYFANPERYSKIHFSYVRGDVIARFIRDVEALYTQMHRVLWCGSAHIPQPIPPAFAFDLLDTPKEFILSQVPEWLFEMTWTCETPSRGENNEPKECGKCEPCLRLQKELNWIASKKPSLLEKPPFPKSTLELESYDPLKKSK